jgi:hypothetical protein
MHKILTEHQLQPGIIKRPFQSFEIGGMVIYGRRGKLNLLSLNERGWPGSHGRKQFKELTGTTDSDPVPDNEPGSLRDLYLYIGLWNGLASEGKTGFDLVF